ncbi:MAG: nitroreductase family protein [Bacteroidota bacterium]
MTNYEELLGLIRKNRSYRRFEEKVRLTEDQLLKWISLSRFIPSGRNMQPLKYAFSVDETVNSLIFEQLAWAGYLKDWKGPEPGERPAAYIAMLKDRSLSENIYCDDGIAVQTILLGAVSDGYGGCIVGSFNKSRVSAILRIPEHLELLWIVALGKPAETVVLEDLQGEDIRYWRDENQVHHVPKRSLEELVFRG